MGFSTNASVVILFVAALVSLGTLFPAAEGSFESVTSAMNDQESRLVSVRNTDVTLDNATYFAGNDTLRVDATNEGTVSLSVNDTDVLVEGTLEASRTTAVEGVAGRTVWAPGEQLRVDVSGIAPAPDRVMVVTNGGVSVSTNTVGVV